MNAHDRIGNGDSGDQLAVPVEISVKAVGVDQVRQRLEVAFLQVLVGILHDAQVNKDVLGLYMADCNVTPLQDKVRCAASFALGFVGGFNLCRGKGVKQGLKGGALGMFGGLACLVGGNHAGNESGNNGHERPAFWAR